MPTITYTSEETAAIAHFAAQTAYGTPPAAAPTSSLLRAAEEIRPLAGILDKLKAGVEASVDASATRLANTVYAGPSSGGAAAGAFRALVPADIPTLTSAKISDLGSAALRDVGSSTGNLVELGGDGKISTSYLPALAITKTDVVGSQAAMLALTSEPGDVAIRTDIVRSFILVASPASTLANWQELLTPADLVSSVAGKTGVVILAAADIASGVFAAARLGSGTADETTVLHGDMVWRALESGGDVLPLVVNGARAAFYADLDDEDHGIPSAVLTIMPSTDIPTLINLVGIGGIANPMVRWEGANGSAGHMGFAEGAFEWNDTGGTTVYLDPGYPVNRWYGHASAIAKTEWASYDGSDHVVVGYMTAGRAFGIALPSAPADDDVIVNSGFNFYLDEAGDDLKIRVRYSDGTLKTGTVALA